MGAERDSGRGWQSHLQEGLEEGDTLAKQGQSGRWPERDSVCGEEAGAAPLRPRGWLVAGQWLEDIFSPASLLSKLKIQVLELLAQSCFACFLGFFF